MIALLGYYGHGSRGDDLLQHTLTFLFGETLAFSVSSPGNPAPVPLEMINEMDALIVGGGTLLGHALPYPLCDHEWLEGVKVPLYVFGAGAKFPHRDGVLEEGRLDSELAEAHHTLKVKSRFFGVRGPLTQELMAREGIKTEVVGDPVMALPLRATAERAPVCLVNFRDPAWFRSKAKYAKAYTDYSKALVEALSEVCTVKAMAFDEADATFLRSLGLEAQVPDLDRLVYEVQTSVSVVAMRLHANVLAAVCGTPFLHLGYELKSWDWQATVAPTKPLEFLSGVLSIDKMVEQWNLLCNIAATGRLFRDTLEENVAHWMAVLSDRANEILREL